MLITAVLLPTLSLAYPADTPVAANPRSRARYIVEFEPSLDNGIHKRFVSTMDDVDLHHLFDHELFTGMSFSVEDRGEATLEELRGKPGVRNVWKARKLQKRDRSISKDVKYIFNPHVGTGVQELHDRNITGQGIVIGMIDEGIDAEHPALQGRILPGYDYCTNSTFSKGMNDAGGHGTFCASVAMGNSTNFMGVAPGAKLRMYKVTPSCINGDTVLNDASDDTLILALLKAYDDKVDVISISEGSDQPFSSTPVSLTVQRLTKYIPIVFAASNEGTALYTGMDGAAAEGAIAVGSYQSNEMITWNATLLNNKGQSVNFTYVSSDGAVVKSNSTYKVDYVQDLCSLVNSTVNGKNKFVVGKMGDSCTYWPAWNAASKNNYTGFLMLEEPSKFDYPAADSDVKTLNFTIATTNKLQQYLESGSGSMWSLKFNTNQQYGVVPRSDNLGGVMAESSSWGPTFEQGFYPQISGPGQYVLGARKMGTYVVESGTSFSCPYVAGVVALYLSGHKNVSSQQVRANLISSAKMSSYKQSRSLGNYMNVTADDKTKFDPVIQQGNGYVDLVAFYDSVTSVLSEPYLNLNDTKHRVSDHVITFQNNGNSTVRYEIRHMSYDLVYARSSNGFISASPPQQVAMSNIVLYSMNLTTLKPGEQTSFNVSIAAPQGLDQSRGPLFSGVFKITGSNGDELNVPYLGLEFDATKWSMWNQKNPVQIGYIDEENHIVYINATSNYTNPINAPVIRNVMAYGTTKLWFDLVQVSYNSLSYVYPPVPGQNGYIGAIMPQGLQLAGAQTPKVDGDSPITFVGPVAKPWLWTFEKFANGSDIPDGQYMLLGRAINMFGNVSNYNDWSLNLTAPFTLQIRDTSNNTSSQTTSTKSRTSKGGATSFSVSTGLVMLQILLAFV